MQKRVLAFLLVMVMVFSLLPVSLVGAEEAAKIADYTVYMQKAHNQTEGSLAIDIYLQASAVSEVTGYQLDVTPAEGLTLTGVVDNTGNDNLKASGGTIIYDPAGQKPITVGTARVLVATITVTGETLPADLSTAFTTVEALVTTKDAQATATVETVATNDCWAEVTGQWKPLTQADVEAAAYKLADANYYLVEDITTTKQLIQCSNVNLDLNGYTLAASGNIDLIKAVDGKFLTISDITATGSALDGTLKAGTLVAGNSSYGGGLYAGLAATLKVSNVNLDGSAIVGTDSGNLLYALGKTDKAAAGKLIANNVHIFGGKAKADATNPVVMGDARGDIALTDVRFSGFDLTPNSKDADTKGNALLSARHSANYGNLVLDNVIAENCNNYAVYMLNKANNKFASVTIKGDTQLADPIYMATGAKVILDLGEKASITIETETTLTAEELGSVVTFAEGATLPEGVLVYGNVGSFVSYKNGEFTFTSHPHDEVDFKAWTDTTTLPTSGNYYLACDVNVSGEKTISTGKTLNLCLNGHTIKQTKANTRVYYVDGVLNLYDCAEEYDADGNWIGGQITGARSTTGGCIRVGRSKAGKLEDADRPTFNMYGGRLADNGNTGTGTSGGAVYITSSRNQKEGAADERGGLFNMYGGELYNNHTGTLGGAVTVWGLSATRSGTAKDGERRAIADGLGATFNMYGGKIHGNSSETGGAVRAYQTDTEVNIEGGEIYNNTAGRGGALSIDNVAKFSVKNVVFTNNRAEETADVARNHYGSGGAIELYNTLKTEATITDCVFEGNTAYRKQKGTGGSDYSGMGGVIYTYASKVRFENCEFTNNTASGYGGVISARADNGYTYVKDSVLTGNTAGGVGPASYSVGKNVTTYDSCTITGNKGANAVYITSATTRLVISGSTVIAGNTNKEGTRLTTSDVYFQGQDARTNLMEVNEMTQGAHVNLYYNASKSPVTVNDVASGYVRLSDDNGTQTTWDCGYITVYKSSTDAGRNVSLVNGEFTFGHYHLMPDGTQQEFTAITTEEVKDSAGKVTGYKAIAPSAAGYYYLPKDAIKSSAWVINVDGVHLCLNGKQLTAPGAAIKIGNGTSAGITFNMYDCTAIVNADGEYVGGGVTGTSGTFGRGVYVCRSKTQSSTLNWYGGAIRNCKATTTGTGGTGGAALYTQAKNTDYPYAPVVNWYNGAIYDNTSTVPATCTGGTATGVMANNGVMTIHDGQFYNNHVDNGRKAASYGGVIYNAGTLTVKDGSFTNNSAEYGGGAIYNTGNAYITGGEFIGNYITPDDNGGWGGAIYNANSTNILEIKGTADKPVIFKDNYVKQLSTTGTDGKVTKSEGRGGAIHLMNGQATVFDYVHFIDNSSEGQGGAIYVGGGSGTTGLTMSNCLLEGNISKATDSTGGGGAMYIRKGTHVLTNNTFKENEAKYRGGAIMGTPDSNTANVTINGGVFDGNTSSQHAGALYVAVGMTLNANGVTFKNNTSPTNFGGVMYTANSAIVANFVNCIFENNSAKNGGALAYDWYKPNCKVVGCTFTGNTATECGGAIYARGNDSSILNIGGAGDEACTFTGNKAKTSGAVHATSSTHDVTVDGVKQSVYYKPVVNISNCTFTENIATGDGAAVKSMGAATLTIADSTITNNTSKIYGAVSPATTSSKMILKGKVIIADNVSTDYVGYAENCDLYFQNYATSAGTVTNAFVDASGLTAGSKIGVHMAEGRALTDVIFTENTSSVAKDYFFVNAESRWILVEQEGELALVKYIAADGTAYGSYKDAIAAAAAAGETVFVAQKDATTENIALAADMTIDLNGADLNKITVAEGKTLTLIDSKTNDYDVSDEDYGKVSAIEGAYNAFAEVGGKRYAVIADEAGALSAHRVYLAINYKTLRPASNGVGFKAIFAGDQVVAESGIIYGIELSGYEEFVDASGNLAVMTAGFDKMEAGATTSTPNQKNVIITQAISAQDTSRYEDDLYGRPFITIGDNTVYGRTVTVNMKEMAENALKSGDAELAAAVLAMIDSCFPIAN